MAARPTVPMRETALTPVARLAGLLETDLKGLMARIVSRPYRAFSARAGRAAAVIDEVPRETLKAEVDALPSHQRLVDNGSLHVYYARAGQIPWVLQEIGRLRELTFRAVGEGTGKCADIDMFDAYYLHMFVWDANAHAITGAYRLGLVDEILTHRGKRGLYTHSLFKYSTRMLESLNPAIELGRSFVRAEYQRSFAPLLLLWTGIARFVERAPQYAVLFGAVSISSNYAPASRRLMVEYLCAYGAEARLACHVRPRRPYRGRTRIAASEAAVSAPKNLDELSRMIARIEHDHKGVPVLLKQYLRLGGRLLGFSLDREFADSLDGLIMVDLRQIAPTVLARYMGKSGTAAFRAYHAAVSEQRRAPRPAETG
jgi:putative hemolysin